jgi:hypothetical protein
MRFGTKSLLIFNSLCDNGHWFSLLGICFPFPMNRLCHLHVENFARRQPPFDHSQSDSGDFSGRKMDAKKIVDHPIDM